jgi:hypothetical protein
MDVAYGRPHRRTRTKLLNQLPNLADVLEVSPRGCLCPRCGLQMQTWEPLDLGHSTPERKRLGLPGDRLEHASCNRSAQDGPVIVRPVGHVPSREW